VVAFVRLSRPLFLYGGFAGVALGAALAGYRGLRLDLATYLWAQGLVTALQLMTHYANDYFDRDGDLAGFRTRWSGGSGVLPSRALPARIALIAALVCAALGLAATARFAIAGNLTVAAIAIALLVCAWTYSAPPLRLSARGLGEIDAALAVGVLVPAIGYGAFAGTLDGAILALTVATAAAILTMILCVEIPDCGFDLIAGKRTLVVRWGPAVAYNRLAYLVIFTTFWTFGDLFQPGLSLRSTLFGLPAFGFALALMRIVFAGDRRPATVAFLGVGLYATTATGLAAAYAFAR
jgi:1,4-dihydroxy-2-naphthoate octaprenyltransferase